MASFGYFLGALPASAGVTHGTYYAINLADEFLVAAIDSRRTFDDENGRRSYLDDICKIAPLSKTAVFLADGIISNTDQRAPKFDGFLIAVDSYKNGAGSLERAAATWAETMRHFLGALHNVANYRKLFDARPEGEIVTGVFLGYDNDGMPVGFKALILDAFRNGAFTSQVTPLKKRNFELLGPEPLVRELLGGNTFRAADIHQKIELEAISKSAVETRMIFVKYLVKTIPAWAQDPGSGGDIVR
jgi:hypothetical protein